MRWLPILLLVACAPDHECWVSHARGDGVCATCAESPKSGWVQCGVDALPSWQERFEAGGHASSRFVTDEGMVEYSMLAPSPADAPPGDENSGKRWKVRLQQGAEDLLAPR
jgi:hypothetical protein